MKLTRVGGRSCTADRCLRIPLLIVASLLFSLSCNIIVVLLLLLLLLLLNHESWDELGTNKEKRGTKKKTKYVGKVSFKKKKKGAVKLRFTFIMWRLV